jgi:hypothetical protein
LIKIGSKGNGCVFHGVALPSKLPKIGKIKKDSYRRIGKQVTTKLVSPGAQPHDSTFRCIYATRAAQQHHITRTMEYGRNELQSSGTCKTKINTPNALQGVNMPLLRSSAASPCEF